MSDLFDAKWWSVPVAVAWIMSRDRDFVRSCEDADGLLAVSIERARFLQSCPNFKFHMDDTRSARQNLLVAMRDGKIRVAGTAFERTGMRSGGRLNQALSAQPLTDIELEDLGFEQLDDEEILVNEDFQSSRGSDFSNNIRGYRNVRLIREDILQIYTDPLIKVAPPLKGLDAADAPFIRRGLEMLDSGKARSANNAAVHLANEFYEKHGRVFSTDLDSHRDRLGRKIKAADEARKK